MTTAQDLAAAERLLASRLGDVRVGQGFDVHAFGPGDHVMVCGIEIPHEVARSVIRMPMSGCTR